MSLSITACGLQPILLENNDFIENIDISSICDGHFDYFKEDKLEKVIQKFNVYSGLKKNYFNKKHYTVKIKIVDKKFKVMIIKTKLDEQV
jgi:hypothetical protein